MKTFGTQGRVYPSRHYVVPRTEEKTEFIKRVKEGRYIVLFAPRQTGKTTFFQIGTRHTDHRRARLLPNPIEF